jgi:hypothetical protein
MEPEPRPVVPSAARAPHHAAGLGRGGWAMSNIVYIVGAVVIVLAILAFFGLR